MDQIGQVMDGRRRIVPTPFLAKPLVVLGVQWLSSDMDGVGVALLADEGRLAAWITAFLILAASSAPAPGECRG